MFEPGPSERVRLLALAVESPDGRVTVQIPLPSAIRNLISTVVADAAGCPPRQIRLPPSPVRRVLLPGRIDEPRVSHGSNGIRPISPRSAICFSSLWPPSAAARPAVGRGT